ncbi:hypothetical protein CHS0354_035907 [Potamilus streckersoni]|uniref:EGF-like domain-containing protein n=1 Tax=Potamilus streckersoni TaxID=2493646 RepID=A0AAE0SFN0_9BIVA|nr:hypothetical protein CHS0354_035907 [Potamilus streckersoni]
MPMRIWLFAVFLVVVDSDKVLDYSLADYQYCDNNPCQHGGTCINHGNSYTCFCETGYYGINCHLDANECRSNPCRNGGTCEDQENGYICYCGPVYTGIYCELTKPLLHSRT